MSNDTRVRRTLHFKFTVTIGDPAQIVTQLKALAPWYELFGGVKVQVLQNVDDPSRFVQVIDYETPEAIESSRQQIASDPKVQAYLQAWRSFVPGAVEVDVYRDVTS